MPRPPLVLLTRGAKARPAQDDVLLASVATPRLRPGSRLVRAASATIPAGTSSGSYGVLTCVDATHRVRERREADPCRGSASRLFVTDAPPAVAGSPAGP